MITVRRYKQICYTILAVLVPLLAGFALWRWVGLTDTLTRVLVYGTMLIWLVLIWRPRRAS